MRDCLLVGGIITCWHGYTLTHAQYLGHKGKFNESEPVVERRECFLFLSELLYYAPFAVPFTIYYLRCHLLFLWDTVQPDTYSCYV